MTKAGERLLDDGKGEMSAEARQIAEAADRMARRLGLRFVIDPVKLAVFEAPLTTQRIGGR